MSKKVPHRRKRINVQTVAIADIENAKWLGIGLLTSVLLFALLFLIMWYLGQNA